MGITRMTVTMTMTNFRIIVDKLSGIDSMVIGHGVKLIGQSRLKQDICVKYAGHAANGHINVYYNISIFVSTMNVW